MSDLGLTHIALSVSSLPRSIAFWTKYAQLQKVHEHPGVVWLSDKLRPFAIVLIELPDQNVPLLPENHIGVAVKSRAELDRLAGEARKENCLLRGPEDAGPIVGYWVYIKDPDGHTLELSHGQEVGLAVQNTE